MNLERNIIGELLHLDKQKRIDAIIELEAIKFEDKECESLFKTITYLTLKDKDVDTVSVFQNNQEVKPEVISSIYHDVVSDAFITQHIYMLKSREHKKDLIKIITENLEQIKLGEFGEDIEEVKNQLLIDLSLITMDDKTEFDDLMFYKDKISEQLNSEKNIEGYSWGIEDLDKWTSGIQKPRVYVIGGLKKSGKTRFLIQTIKSLYEQDIQVAFLSLEMPAYEVTKLLCSSITGLNDLRFRSASRLKPEEKYEFDNIVFNSELLGVECRAGLDLEKILSRIRRLSKMGFKVICVDYIQRIAHDRKRQAQELEDISIKLSDAARQYNVALIIISQLNVLGEREIPNVGHLKGSGGIGESADTILLLDNIYRRTKQDKDKNQIDIYIEQRHGDSGKLSLQCDLGSCQFRNLIVMQTTDGIF